MSVSCVVAYINDNYFTHYKLISSGIIMPFDESFSDIKEAEINGIINQIKIINNRFDFGLRGFIIIIYDNFLCHFSKYYN